MFAFLGSPAVALFDRRCPLSVQIQGDSRSDSSEEVSSSGEENALPNSSPSVPAANGVSKSEAKAGAGDGGATAPIAAGGDN